MWTLTLSVAGRKRVEAVPAESVDELEAAMARGRAYLDAIAEVRGINAELFRLWKRKRRSTRRR